MLSDFRAILLDVNSTFMFGEDRYGPQHDYYRTYVELGGRRLDEAEVREAVDGCIACMKPIYLDAGRCDSFPQVSELLAVLPATRNYPAAERRALEMVIAAHEVGHIPSQYAEALKRLSETHQLGIVSNIWSAKDLWIEELLRVQVLECFKVIVFSSDGPSMKPSRRLFEQALNGLDLPPSEVVLVGDSLRCDIAGAAAVGMATVWIDRQGSGPPSTGPRPTWVIRDLLELARSDARAAQCIHL